MSQKIKTIKNSNLIDKNILVTLAKSHLFASVAESELSVNILTESFTNLVEDLEDIINTYKDNMNGLSRDDLEKEIGTILLNIFNRVNEGVMAFQFFDRMTQQLEHVDLVMSKLYDLDKNNCQFNTELQDLYNSYTMESERKVHEDVAKGLDLEDIFVEIKSRINNGYDDDVELF